MSADDFQTKYASVMESMLKSAVAETTKLFETMVDELKAEISKIRQENEDLKTKCRQFEKARSQPAVCSGESEPVPGRSEGSERRDTAVQCDLVSFRTLLVEQCQPLQPSVQNRSQQCGYEEMEYVLQEHNYQTQGEGNSQMAYILVRQESVLKQEEVDSTVVCGPVLSDKSGSTWPTLCGTEQEGPFINSVSSTREISLPPQHEGTQVAMEPACFRTCSVLQGAQNQSSEQEHPPVISLASIKDDREYAFSQKISENCTQGEYIISDKHHLVVAQPHSNVEPLEKELPPVVLKQCQRQGEKSANKPTGKYANVNSTKERVSQPTVLNKGKACDGSDNDMAEGEASSPLLVRRRRGRPPKKESKKPPTIRVEEAGVFSEVHASNITSLESPQTCPHGPRESLSIVIPSVQERANTALEDYCKVGSLAVSVASLSKRSSSEKEKTSESKDFEERPIQILPSTELSFGFESDESSPTAAQLGERCTSVTLQDAMLLVEAMNQSTAKKTPALPQNKTAPHVCSVQPAGSVAAELQTPPPPVETNEAGGNLPIKKDLSQTQLSKECTFTLSNCTTASIPTSTAVTQTSVKSSEQHPLHPLTTSMPPSKPGNPVPHKIIVMPKTVFLNKNAAQSPAQLSTAISTVVAAQNNGLLSGSTTAGLPLLRASLSSVPQKTVYAASSKSLPVLTSQSTHTAADPQSGNLTHPKITIIIPRRVSAVALQKHESQSIVPMAKQLSAKSSAPVKVSSPHLISSSQEVGLSEDMQTHLDEAATVWSQKRQSTSDNMESPKPSASVSETNASVAPQTCEKKLAVVVRLTRLPFQLSTKDTVVVSRQPNGSSGTQSILKESTRQDKPSEVIVSKPPQAPVLSPDIWPSLETSVAESENNSDVSEESNKIQDEASLSFENCTVLEESSDSRHVQPSTPSKVSSPVFEKSTVTINTTEPSAKSGTAGEPASILDKMTKAQFLAQLAVSPVLQNPEKVPCNDCIDARACVETSSDETRLQENSLVAQLRGHLKTHFQAKKNATNPELCTDRESWTGWSKKPRLDNDSLNDKNTTNEPTPIIPKETGPHKEGVKPKSTAREPTTSSRRCKAAESTHMMPRRSSSCRNDIGSKNEKSTFGMSSSVKESDSPNTSKNTSPQMNSLCTDSGSSKKNGGCPNGAKSTSTRPKRTGSGRDVAGPKKTTFISASPTTCGLTKNGAIPIESTSVHPQRCTVTKDGSRTKNTKSETGQDGTGPKKNLREVNAKKLAKTKNEAKAKNCHQSELQSEAERSQFPENQSGCVTLKTCTTTAVWTPPRMPFSKTALAGGKRSANLPIQTEVVSPNPPKALVVYPPSISLHPIPVKAPPVVSPLQPLSVIGRRLLKNQCGECGRVLSSGAALESHVRLHSGRRPFSCMLCGKRFPDSKGLKRHGRVHRNGRIHICPHCEKGFVYRFGLTKHVQMVHSRIKPFVCQICNSGFFTKRDVEAHIRIHTGEKPFHCNLCEKKFTRRVELNVHLRWHNGEKRHWCPYCGKGFLDFNNLKRHKYIHTGEKPHSCPHCPKHFTQSGHLKKHVKNVHKIQ